MPHPVGGDNPCVVSIWDDGQAPKEADELLSLDTTQMSAHDAYCVVPVLPQVHDVEEALHDNAVFSPSVSAQVLSVQVEVSDEALGVKKLPLLLSSDGAPADADESLLEVTDGDGNTT
jgi:hypothetical protein